MGKDWKQWMTFLGGAPKSLQMVIAAMKLKDAYSISPKIRNKTRVPTLTTTINIVLEVLATAIRAEEEVKSNPDRKRRSETLTVCR